MAFGKRQWAKRKLDMANSALDTAITHLAEVGFDYEASNPEISEPISVLMQAVNVLKPGIDSINELI